MIRTNSVSTNGVAADIMLFYRGAFWVLPLIYIYIYMYIDIPKKCQGIPFSLICQNHYFCKHYHYIYIYIYIYICLSLYIYIYIYIFLSLSLSLYIYIYMYTLVDVYLPKSAGQPPRSDDCRGCRDFWLWRLWCLLVSPRKMKKKCRPASPSSSCATTPRAPGTWTWTDIYIYIYIYIYTHMYICIYTCIHVYMYIYVYAYIRSALCILYVFMIRIVIVVMMYIVFMICTYNLWFSDTCFILCLFGVLYHYRPRENMVWVNMVLA